MNYLRLLLPFIVLFIYSPLVLSQQTINWMTFEEAIEAHERQPKKIIIDMYTDWCGWCKRMDKTTFQSEDIAKYINRHFYPVKFNAETKRDILFKNEKYSFVQQGNRGYHELAIKLSERLGRLSFPTVIFIDEDLQIIQPLAGFMEPDQFAPVISYIAQEQYLQTPWKQYQENFTGLVFN
jgi:thioredoxin-related protein